MNNLNDIIYIALRYYKVKITFNTLDNLLKSNYKFPSLIALSETFEEIGVQSEIYKLPSSEFEHLDQPFIAQLSESKSEFVFVNKIDDIYFYYQDQNKISKKIKKKDVVNEFSGLIILIESVINAKLKFKKEFNRENIFKYSGVTFFACIFFYILFLNQIKFDTLNYLTFSIIGLNIIGFIVSIILASDSYRDDKTVFGEFCYVSKRVNCKSVITSKYSSIDGFLSIADFSMIYFLSHLIFQILYPSYLNVLAFYSLLTLSVIPISLYYQLFKIKSLCILCCSVLIILIAEYILCRDLLVFEFDRVIFFVWFLVIILLGIVITYFTKTINLLLLENKIIKLQNMKFKRNPIVLKSLISGADDLHHIEDIFRFTIKRGDGADNILVILSLSCDSCYEEFKNIIQISKSKKNINISIVFTINELEPLGVLNSLYYINENKSLYKLIDAIIRWYETKNYKTWLRNHPVPLDYNKIHNLCTDKFNIIQQLQVERLPKVYYNNKLLPVDYNVRDLEYFIE
ncbi:vitamin K epoxide reductase family protein [Marinifilum sp. D737]|uniref:vitamin K epoxide reductase family protein n=1 Tax=Marinifilum sp. D737 TaxID=2969628 RepID=UPI0022743343|nr:vitamin K epoxide reductase family protein [Marinifilum sp. D737]MCY1634603.1 cysteine peptidase family C39 domain-containing protein [Marinifilum sp. D737]